MDDPAAGGHPLDVSRPDASPVPHAVAVVDRPREHVRDRLDSAVGMPREAGEIVLGPFVPEVVEKEEGVVVGRRAEPERPAEPHSGALDRRLGLDEALDRSDCHGLSFSYLQPDHRVPRRSFQGPPSA